MLILHIRIKTIDDYPTGVAFKMSSLIYVRFGILQMFHDFILNSNTPATHHFIIDVTSLVNISGI